jgi:hypothetical protein
VDRETPGYIVREKCKRNRLRMKTGKRDGREECKILTECWRVKKKNAEKWKVKYYQRNGFVSEEVERLWAEGRWMKGTKTRRRKRVGENQRIEVEGVWEVYGRGIPEYLGKQSAREKKMMARFGCRNEEGESRYWTEGRKANGGEGEMDEGGKG